MPQTDLPRVLRAIICSSLVASATLVPNAARGQLAPTGASVACAPGIPGCSTLRFTFMSPGQLSMNSLFLSVLGGGYTFAEPFGSGNPGTYSAEDYLGAFGGSTTISNSASSIFIAFLGENGFPLELDAGFNAFIDIEAIGPAGGDGSGIDFTYRGEGIASGESVVFEGGNVTVTPEPATISLIATGLAMTAAYRRRRRASSV
jgi:hypothetical protein